MPTPAFNITALRREIGSHLGSVLTPEIATAIELAAHEHPDLSIDPASLGSRDIGDGFVIAAERMRDILPELHAMHVAHWAETEKHRHGLHLKPDYDAMLADERAGCLVQFTVRRHGKLVGNLRMYIGKSRHTSEPIAVEDTLFIDPSARDGSTGAWVALALMRFAEKRMLWMGAREIEADSKLLNNAGVLMRRMGYEAVATKFAKVFKENRSVQE